ncbi:MAG: DUF427 domain-containing protein [Myxococcota bacterium]
MPKRESLYHKYPEYRVDLEPHPGRVRVTFAGEIIADSVRAVVLNETKHAPVIYIPREDVRMSHLEGTDHQTFCPFKGEAAYWSIRVGDHVEQNAVWTYPDPFDEVMALKDYVSFYQDRPELQQEPVV